MRLLSRPLALAGALALGASAVGCSYEHGPLSDTPDTTSLGTAPRWGIRYISTSEGLVWRPRDPNAIIPGTTQGELSPLTTQAKPLVTLLGTRADWSFGQTFEPVTGWAVNTWTSGPILPVEATVAGSPTAPGSRAPRVHAQCRTCDSGGGPRMRLTVSRTRSRSTGLLTYPLAPTNSASHSKP